MSKESLASKFPTVNKCVTVVLGAQWGDEGKGKIVDMLAQKTNIVCRCQVPHINLNLKLTLLFLCHGFLYLTKNKVDVVANFHIRLGTVPSLLVSQNMAYIYYINRFKLV